MRRGKNSGLKKILFIYGGILVILIITCIVVYTSYNRKIKESAEQSLLAAEKLTELVPNNLIEETSSELSKSIEEALNNHNVENQTEDKVNEEAEEKVENETAEQNVSVSNENVEQPVEQIAEPVVEEPVKKELEFSYPVDGEIAKAYSVDNLVFSETLQEWIVHKGIDIKAPRTSVVKAAEEGTVKAIKNDPRYGLTVIIEHIDGFKTIYSNLLTTEFVEEGETVTKGQSLGTVGNSAAFEIADEPHLHFEILKDEENVDPSLYLK